MDADKVVAALGCGLKYLPHAVAQRLVTEPASVNELAVPFGMVLPSFMKHPAVMENCGLTVSTKAGRVRTCRLEPKRLAVAEKWLSTQRRGWEGKTGGPSDGLCGKTAEGGEGSWRLTNRN